MIIRKHQVGSSLSREIRILALNRSLLSTESEHLEIVESLAGHDLIADRPRVVDHSTMDLLVCQGITHTHTFSTRFVMFLSRRYH